MQGGEAIPGARRKAELLTIQAGRAIAALLVVGFHTSISIFALRKYFSDQPFRRLFDFGHAGVDFFFVLSGFIIVYVHASDMGRSGSLRPYLWKRFTRIYPIYWLILGVTLPAYVINRTFGSGHELEPLTLVSSFLLVHVPNHGGILVVSWTLFHEVLFYAVFALVILLPRLGLALLIGWTACCSWDLIHATDIAIKTRSDFYFSPFNLLFVMGLSCAWILRRNRIPAPSGFVLVGITLFFATGLEEDYYQTLSEGTRLILYGFGSAISILGAVELDRSKRLRVWRWIVFLGEASYSIYLAHFMILSLLAKLFVRLGANHSLPNGLSFLAIAGITVAISCIIHLSVERPLLRILRRQVTSPPERAATPDSVGTGNHVD
jgi:peptidoglycan/LPS O-acetylase OafA/YrhL